jgi:glycerol kinase
MILVIDVGTTGLRAAVVTRTPRWRPLRVPPRARPDSPARAGRVRRHDDGERVLDAARAASTSRWAARRRGRHHQPAGERSCGIAPPASRSPGLGWQDLRTVGECITARPSTAPARPEPVGHQDRLAARQHVAGGLDPARAVLRHGRHVDRLDPLEGALHVTDHTNAAITGLYSSRLGPVEQRTCDSSASRPSMLPVDRRHVGRRRPGHRPPGAPPIAAMVGDQQASLVGQGCIEPGMAKITFGTGGMLDMCTGADAPTSPTARRTARSRSSPGRSIGGAHVGHVEAHHALGRQQRRVAVRRPRPDRRPGREPRRGEWLRRHRRRRVRAGPARSRHAAVGLRRPRHPARGDARHRARSTWSEPCSRASPTAAPTSSTPPRPTPACRSPPARRRRHERNPTFVQALADATGKPVEVSPMAEATTLGASEAITECRTLEP